MKFYVTKYALTQGILEVDGEVADEFPTMIVCPRNGYRCPYHKPYWHTTREEAEAHRLELVKRKIASVKKQLAKLEKMQESAEGGL